MLTKNFKLEEFTRSSTASQLGIDNLPSPQVLAKLQTLCRTVLQPIRDKYQKPIIVTSGYRCQKLNKAVGGAQNSDHMYGTAADIAPNPNPSPARGKGVDTLSNRKEEVRKLFSLIKEMIENKEITVKQLIDEKDYSWIHISFQDGRTNKRNQILHLP